MKLIIVVLFSLNALIAVSQNQCKFDDIFPVQHGISPFKSTTILATKKNISENKESNRIISRTLNGWKKFDYLNGDSVLILRYYYKFSYHPCFKGNSSEFYLTFVDNKLYNINITINFSSKDFNNCTENFFILVKNLKPHFPYSMPTKTTDKSSSYGDRIIGEGFNLYRSEAEVMKEKYEEISIRYKIEYETKYESKNNEVYETGNVDNYKIEIQYVNLKNTKLTRNRYY